MMLNNKKYYDFKMKNKGAYLLSDSKILDILNTKKQIYSLDQAIEIKNTLIKLSQLTKHYWDAKQKSLHKTKDQRD